MGWGWTHPRKLYLQETERVNLREHKVLKYKGWVGGVTVFMSLMLHEDLTSRVWPWCVFFCLFFFHVWGECCFQATFTWAPLLGAAAAGGCIWPPLMMPLILGSLIGVWYLGFARGDLQIQKLFFLLFFPVPFKGSLRPTNYVKLLLLTTMCAPPPTQWPL